MAANMAFLALIILAVVGGSVAAGWPWWAIALAAVGAFFGGAQVIERTAPGTRLLHWLGVGR